jgi:hypothetical protein
VESEGVTIIIFAGIAGLLILIGLIRKAVMPERPILPALPPMARVAAPPLAQANAGLRWCHRCGRTGLSPIARFCPGCGIAI